MKNNVRNIQSSYLARIMTAIVCMGMMGTTIVEAVNLGVTNIRDSGPGSLREAMFNAKSGDSIIFAPTLMGIISLESPLPWINGNLTIQGPLLGNVAIDGVNEHQIFFANHGTISISHFTLTNGFSKGGDGGGSAVGNGGGAMGAGGGIFVNTNAHVTLKEVSLFYCSAQGGDGAAFSNIYTAGTGGGGGGGYNGGLGGDGGPNFGVGGGGGGGGGFGSTGGNAMDGGGGGAGVTASVNQQMLAGNAQDGSGPQGGNGGVGFSGPVAHGGTNGFPGNNANSQHGGGGGGGGGVTAAIFSGGNGGMGGAVGGGGGGGGGAKGGLGGSGADFGGGGGGGGSVISNTSARGGFGGFAGGGGGGAGGIVSHAGGHGARGGFGGGGGGGGPENLGGSGGADLGGNGGDDNGGGGGGAGCGGAIFVRSNGSLKMIGGTIGGNTVAGGMGGQNDNPGKNGKAKGHDMYIMQSAVVFLENVNTKSKHGMDIQGGGTIVHDDVSLETLSSTNSESDLAAEAVDGDVEKPVYMTKEAWEAAHQEI